MHGTLIVQRDDVLFTPNDGTWTLEGKATGNIVAATRSRPSFDHNTYLTTMKATLSDARAIGTYVTPTCTYSFDLPAF